MGAKSLSEMPNRLSSILTESAETKKELLGLKDKMASMTAKNLKDEFKDIAGYKVLAKHFEGEENGGLIKLGDTLKTYFPDYVLVLAGGNADAIPLVVFVGGKALENNNAGNLVRSLAGMLGGSGGGRPNMANGRGKDISKLNKALEDILGEIK